MISPMLFPDSKIELKLEKREPLKGRAKTPVTLKQRRTEHNQVSGALWELYDHRMQVRVASSVPPVDQLTPSVRLVSLLDAVGNR